MLHLHKLVELFGQVDVVFEAEVPDRSDGGGVLSNRTRARMYVSTAMTAGCEARAHKCETVLGQRCAGFRHAA